MLVCNVSQLQRRAAITAGLTEAASALDAPGTGNVVFATLVDDPASVRDFVDAYSGLIMREAANATATVSSGLAYAATVAETASANASQDATKGTVTWTTTFSGTLNTASAGWSGYNIRQWIAATQLSTNGSSVRVTLQAAAASSAVIGSIYIGHAAASGDPYDFDGNQVQLRVGGSGSFTVTGGTPLVTDAAAFALDHTKNLIIAMFFSGTSSINSNSSFGLGNAIQHYKSAANETSVSDVSGYTVVNGTLSVVSKIEVS